MSELSPFMRAALEAAESVRGSTSPNPWVGAVVVKDGEIVARGATSPPPGLHAEAVAISADIPDGATLYVTLEPCAPFPGKRTPSCAMRIIERGIRNVVVALEDADPRVAGQGIAMLREAGVAVEVGDGREAVMRSLRPYLKHRQTGTPYVVAKFAASLDGRISANSGDSKWITGPAAREMVHKERARVDAILTGSGTVIADDPALTARTGGVLPERQPVRVVVDSRGRIPPEAQVLHGPGRAIVATASNAPAEWRRAITETGATVLACGRSGGGVDLKHLLETLGEQGFLSVWVEGGGTLLGALFDDGHVDELWAFLAPRIIGGDGKPAVAGAGFEGVADAHRLREVVVEQVAEDVLVRGYTGPWDYDDA